MPVRWETDSTPGVGQPQGRINQEIIDPADILVAVFRSKVGSPTGKEDSGTIEEIKRGIEQGKQVMIYFSSNEDDKTNPDPDQTEKLHQFKKWCRERTLYVEYEDHHDLVKQMNRHLGASVASIMESTREPLDAPPDSSDTGSTVPPRQTDIEPLDTGLVRRDVQMRACIDASGLVTELTEDEIRLRFTITNIGRHKARITKVKVVNAEQQIYSAFSPHGEDYPPNSGRLHHMHVPRAIPKLRGEQERWRLDVSVEFTDGVGSDIAGYVFYLEGADPKFSIREDRDSAALSQTCRIQRGQ